MGKSAKQRKSFDALVSKILFLELGIASISVGALVFFKNPINESLSVLLGGGFLIAGLFCFYPCFIQDDKKVTKWAENTGNHELMFIFVGVAFGIAALLRGSK